MGLRHRAFCAAVLSVLATAPGLGAAARGFRVEGGEPPSTLRVGEAVEVAVRVVNTGTMTWSADRPINLSYHWLDDGGTMVERDGARTALSKPIRPGESVRVLARVQAPSSWGARRLQWDVVEEGVAWFSERMPRRPATFPVEVLPPAEAYAFRVVASQWPLAFVGGGTRAVRVGLRNTGSAPWEPSDPLRVSYRWRTLGGRKLDLEGRRSEIERAVAPGAGVDVEARVDPPRACGLYRLEWAAVYEHLTWLPNSGGGAGRLVLVLPGVPTLLLLVLAGAALAGLSLGRWRETVRRALRQTAPLADLGWLAATLAVKQGLVLERLPRTDVAPAEWAMVSAVVLVPLLLLWVPQRVRPWLSWLVGAGGSLILLADAVVFRFHGGLLSVAMLQAARQTGTVTASIASLLEWRDLLLFIDLPAALALAWWAARLRPAKRLRPAAAAVAAVLLLPGVWWVWTASREEVGPDVQRYSATQTAERLGLVGFHLVDLWEQGRALAWGVSVDAGDRERVLSYLERTRPSRAPGPYFGAAEGANLVMIQVESLQSFVVGFEIDGQPVTPNLDRLCTEGTLFRRCVDQTAFGRSSDAELISQASLLPVRHGAAAFRHSGNRFVGLADVLAERGYTTLSAVPFEPGFWNRVVLHGEYGFATRLFQDAFGPGRQIGWGLNDGDFLEQMAARLDGARQPFAALLITLSLHHPFDGFPPELRELGLGGLESTPVGGYLHAMHYFDAALGRFIERLRSAGRLDDTVLVLWGDHDAGFEVKRWTERASARREQRQAAEVFGFPASDFGLNSEDRVPLLIRLPGGAGPSGVFDRPVGLVDMAPTVAALLGVDPRPLPWLGANLAVPAADRVVVRPQRGFIDETHLWLAAGAPKCYRWRSGDRVPPAECSPSLAVAERRRDVSELILEGDLQPWLRDALSEGPR